jgi:RNA polymerase sigma factor (sigma-70 family)
MAAGSEPAYRTRRPTLAELYERHVGHAASLARLLTGDAFLAEDLAHDAFLRAAGRFGNLRDPAAFEAYLRRTVVNLCNARLRRLKLERAFLRREGRAKDPSSASSVEDRDEVWGAIQHLPSRQRAAVVLRFYEDLSEREVGDILRCSPRAVNALISRAMNSLRESLNVEDRDARH